MRAARGPLGPSTVTVRTRRRISPLKAACLTGVAAVALGPLPSGSQLRPVGAVPVVVPRAAPASGGGAPLTSLAQPLLVGATGEAEEPEPALWIGVVFGIGGGAGVAFSLFGGRSRRR